MVSGLLINRKTAKGICALLMLGASFGAGYYVNSHYGKRIEGAGAVISEKLGKGVFSGNIEDRMAAYKQTLLDNQDKYKRDIIDITMFGMKEYPTDVFVKGTGYGIDFLQESIKKYTKKE